MNIIKFIRNIGNPHGMEWRKIGFLNLWALDDWYFSTVPRDETIRIYSISPSVEGDVCDHCE